MSKMSGEESEVIFDQPEKKAGAMEPDGPVPNRRKEEGWLEATEPYHGARPRATDFDRPVDIGLGATMGGLDEDVEPRDSDVPRLPPEKQIQQEEEVQTPPRRELRRMKVTNRGDRRSRQTSRGWVRRTWRTSREIQLLSTDQTTNGHRWRHWRIQCLVCSEIYRSYRRKTDF